MSMKDIASPKALEAAERFMKSLPKRKISLGQYLEYLTPKERNIALSQGQTNLNLAPREALVPEALTKEQLEFLEGKEEFKRSYTGVKFDRIHKNLPIKHINMRMIMCANGNYYWCSSQEANHNVLFKLAFFNREFPEMLNKLEEVRNWYEWWIDPSSLNSFVCLTYNGDEDDFVGLSESYDHEDELLELIKPGTALNAKYTNLIKNKTNLRFVAHPVETKRIY